MTDEELGKLLEYTKWKPRQDALVRFIADTACRRGGAAGLRVQDIDFAESGAIVTEKGDKTRRVAYGETTKKALLTWLSKHPRTAGEYVFSTRGQPITSEATAQLFRRCCNKAGIRSLGPHTLRRRKGFQFSDQGISATTAATALGHSDPAITMKHYYPHDWETARAALEALAIQDE
jgi:integrase